MFHIITRQVENALRPWWENRLRQAGARLFAHPDAQAHRNGWTVTERWGGLARTYRDPRFDALVRCATCAGSGFNGTAARGACAACGGSGRVVLTANREPARR